MIIEEDDKFIVEIDGEVLNDISRMINFFKPNINWLHEYYIGDLKFSFTDEEMALQFWSLFGKGRI